MTIRAKLVVAALTAMVAFAGACGFAAALGLDTAGLAAGNTIVAGCGSGMTLSYTTSFSPADSGYVVREIELADIPAGCRSKSLSATFYDPHGAAVGSPVDATLTASGTTQSVAVAESSGPIAASRIGGVSVVVY